MADTICNCEKCRISRLETKTDELQIQISTLVDYIKQMVGQIEENSKAIKKLKKGGAKNGTSRTNRKNETCVANASRK